MPDQYWKALRAYRKAVATQRALEDSVYSDRKANSVDLAVERAAAKLTQSAISGIDEALDLLHVAETWIEKCEDLDPRQNKLNVAAVRAARLAITGVMMPRQAASDRFSPLKRHPPSGEHPARFPLRHRTKTSA